MKHRGMKNIGRARGGDILEGFNSRFWCWKVMEVLVRHGVEFLPVAKTRFGWCIAGLTKEEGNARLCALGFVEKLQVLVRQEVGHVFLTGNFCVAWFTVRTVTGEPVVKWRVVK